MAEQGGERPMIARGIPCPFCREHTPQRVTHTMKKGNMIMRYRRCQQCNMPFATEERVRSEERKDGR